jgi:mono/diheme cytochrome c family protein
MSGTHVARAVLEVAPPQGSSRPLLENVMTINRIKLGSIALFVLLFAALVFFRTGSVDAAVPSVTDDTAATYKAKCAMCHTATAAKFFDTAKSDENHVEAILKGRKGEKPPYMPGFGEKGITPEIAQGLVAHMRQLRSASQ